MVPYPNLGKLALINVSVPVMSGIGASIEFEWECRKAQGGADARI